VEAAAYEFKEAIQARIRQVAGSDMSLSNVGSINVQYRMNGAGAKSSATIRPAGVVHFPERGTAAHTIPGWSSFGNRSDDDQVRRDIQHPGAYSRKAPPRPWATGRADGREPAQAAFERAVNEAIEGV
jgi:hypothetical protein